MPTPPFAPTVADPVCGARLDAGSALCVAKGAIVYCFCSRACLDRFHADPEQYANIIAAGGGEIDTAGTPVPVPEAVQFVAAPSRDLDADAAFAITDEGPAWDGQVQGSIPLPRTPLPSVSAGAAAATAPGMFERLMPGSQRRFARRVSRELLAVHERITQADPKLRGRDLYRRVAMQRLRTDVKGADAVLQKADESFAWWPTTREINFADVVHMIAILEYHASHGKAHWIIADMGRVVAEEIDHTL